MLVRPGGLARGDLESVADSNGVATGGMEGGGLLRCLQFSEDVGDLSHADMSSLVSRGCDWVPVR